jgi:Zn-finger nucleic acid-binding protein
MIARRTSCPDCGGAVDEQARACPYCSAPIATVRCAGCFHMNVAAAAHCAGCGRELGLEPIPEGGELRCPDCKEPLSRFRSAAGALLDCPKCGGQLVEHALLRDLLERREVYGHTAPRHTARPPPPPSTRVRYVPCPACGQLMNRKNFAGISGVIVDVCKQHGIWFDRGELPRVLAFAESGGLARARRRQIEELERAERALAAAAAGGSAGGERSPLSTRSGVELGTIDLLGFLHEILRG